MFDQTVQRIGFACKYLHPNQSLKKSLLEEVQRPLNTKTTTARWLGGQTRDVAADRLWSIMQHNIQSFYKLVDYVRKLPPEQRMVRLGSDCLPLYTHANWKWFWQQTDVQAYCETHFSKVGDLARQGDVRLSMHPGQFTVLASHDPAIVKNSIAEFEYHADMARYMGFGKEFQDFKINVHISGKAGPAGFRAVLPQLSTEARNCITVENEECKWGLDSCLELADVCPVVFDIHHAWINEGRYLSAADDRIKRVIESWRGVRPTMHYSYSRSEHFPETFDHTTMPDLQFLLDVGIKRQKLRAHSDRYPNDVVNSHVLTFSPQFDIMCEAKLKNLASLELHSCKNVLAVTNQINPTIGGIS
jgi:UV DNA damage repair endonuclease